jgi:Glycosyl transferases group 1
MRILVSCLQSRRRHPIPAYEFWRAYFVRGIEEAGHEVLEVPDVDWAEGLVHGQGEPLKQWRRRTWESVRSFVHTERQGRSVDLFLSYLHPRQIETGAISDLQADGIPCVNFFCDNVREFRQVPAEFRPFALHWVPEFEALPMYRGAGLPHIHAPMPCWVPEKLRCVPVAETGPPTFIGSADILRRDLLSRAVRAGATLKVCGPGWSDPDDLEAVPRRRQLSATLVDQALALRHQGIAGLTRKVESHIRPLRPAPLPACSVAAMPDRQDEYFGLIREAAVCLGINRVPTARRSNRNPLRYSRLRDIEAPMLGACYLTEWTDGVERLFERGSEIETYRTAQELSAKLRELNADPARRRAMRERAQRRALADHCVGRSIARIGERVGLSA